MTFLSNDQNRRVYLPLLFLYAWSAIFHLWTAQRVPIRPASVCVHVCSLFLSAWEKGHIYSVLVKAAQKGSSKQATTKNELIYLLTASSSVKSYAKQFKLLFIQTLLIKLDLAVKSMASRHQGEAQSVSFVGPVSRREVLLSPWQGIPYALDKTCMHKALINSEFKSVEFIVQLVSNTCTSSRRV